MTSTVLADMARAERRLFIARQLSGELLDRVDQLQEDLRENGAVRVQPQLQAQVDGILALTCVIHDELAELEL